MWNLSLPLFGSFSMVSTVGFPFVSGRTKHIRAATTARAPIIPNGTVWWIRFASTTNGALTAPRRLATPTKPKPLFLQTKKISKRRLHYEKLVYYYHTAHNYSIQLKSILLPMVYNRIYF